MEQLSISVSESRTHPKGRICNKCEQWKAEDQFHVNDRRTGRLRSYCISCCAIRSREKWAAYNAAQPGSHQYVVRERLRQKSREWAKEHAFLQKESKFKAKYGQFTYADKDALLAFQGNECALCGSKDPKCAAGWHTDHDHKLGHVRGILCQDCNINIIGPLEANPEFLLPAPAVREYLINPPLARWLRYLAFDG